MTDKTTVELDIEVVRQLHMMARRCADDRQSYITSMFNDISKRLLALGVLKNETDTPDDTIWARDRMGRAYDGLTDEQATLGKS